MTKNALNTDSKADLIGMNPICDFSEKSAATLLNWKKQYGFPIFKKAGIWVSSKKDIINWYTERGMDPLVLNPASTNDKPRKMPPHHHDIFVRIVVACLPPKNESVEAPPPSAARPPPFPA